MPMSTMMVGGKKEKSPDKDSSPKKPAASPRRGQKNKQHKANSGEKVIQNKASQSSPAITRNSKVACTQNSVDATAATPSKKVFQNPSDSEDNNLDNDSEDSDTETIDEKTKRLKALCNQNDDSSDVEAPNHQGNRFLKITVAKQDQGKAPKNTDNSDVISIDSGEDEDDDREATPDTNNEKDKDKEDESSEESEDSNKDKDMDTWHHRNKMTTWKLPKTTRTKQKETRKQKKQVQVVVTGSVTNEDKDNSEEEPDEAEPNKPNPIAPIPIDIKKECRLSVAIVVCFLPTSHGRPWQNYSETSSSSCTNKQATRSTSRHGTKS
jgi:hypothetical protein